MISHWRNQLRNLLLAASLWSGVNDYGAGVYGGSHYKDRQKWRNVPAKRKNRKRRKS